MRDEIGDRTVRQMQFVEEEIATIASELPEEANDVARLERKVETLTALVHSLNRRIESIDAVVARALSR